MQTTQNTTTRAMTRRERRVRFNAMKAIFDAAATIEHDPSSAGRTLRIWDMNGFTSSLRAQIVALAEGRISTAECVSMLRAEADRLASLLG